MLKSKIGLGKTKLPLIGVDLYDDVVQGVFAAREAIGGHFPEHIKSITIKAGSCSDDKSKPYDMTRGVCSRLDDKSRITIYKGSLIDTAKCPIDLVGEAKMTTLHEVNHANYGFTRHQTNSYNEDLPLEEQEKMAREFAVNNFMRK